MDNCKKVKSLKDSSHFLGHLYNSKGRFNSYWHQISETLQLNPSEVLEVGIGNRFVSKYLGEQGLNVTTLDINEHLSPGIAGNVLNVPFKDNMFRLINCCELLEHLPYRSFNEALRELYRVSKKNIILSLPDVTTVYRINIELPRIKPIRLLVPHPFPRPFKHEYDGVHFWEIGKLEYPLGRILNDIRSAGFKILKTYRVFEFYFHRYFLLEK